MNNISDINKILTEYQSKVILPNLDSIYNSDVIKNIKKVSEQMNKYVESIQNVFKKYTDSLNMLKGIKMPYIDIPDTSIQINDEILEKLTKDNEEQANKLDKLIKNIEILVDTR